MRTAFPTTASGAFPHALAAADTAQPSPATIAAARVHAALANPFDITAHPLDAAREFKDREKMLGLAEMDLFQHYRKETMQIATEAGRLSFSEASLKTFGARRYAQFLDTIETTATAARATRDVLSIEEGVAAMYATTCALREIAHRWNAYSHLYCTYEMMRDTDALGRTELAAVEESGKKLTRKSIARMESMVPRAPALERLFRESLALYFSPLEKQKDALEQRPGNVIAHNPEGIKIFVHHQHRTEGFVHDELYDDAIDMLLNLEVTRIECELYGKGLPPHMRDEQHDYGGTPYAVLSALVAYLNPASHDVFYDLGSGYGRPTLFAGMVSNAKVRGIEMVPERINKAEEIRGRLGLAHVDYRAGFADDPAIDIGDGTIFFLFNPFEKKTLKRVIARLKTIAAHKTIRIAIYGPCAGTFERENSWLTRIQLINGRVFVYESF